MNAKHYQLIFCGGSVAHVPTRDRRSDPEMLFEILHPFLQSEARALDLGVLDPPSSWLTLSKFGGILQR